MKNGTCQLCGNVGVLHHGHVWPAWAYRDYAAEQERGGRFIRLGNGKLDNHAEKYYWFCQRCENETLGGWDRYASTICKSISKGPVDPVAYDQRFLSFAVSISLRTAMAYLERNSGRSFPQLTDALRHWKAFLLGRKRRLEPFSQHTFVVHDSQLERHNALGGNVFQKEHFVYTQVGPLWIFGLLDRRHLDLSEIKTWDRSKLLSSGGVLHPTKEWRVGTNITMNCMKLLARFEKFVIGRALDIVPALKHRL